MSIRGIVFDIGGVLENNPRLGIDEKWEALLGLQPGELLGRMGDVFRGGSVGTVSLEAVHQALRDNLGMSEAEVGAYMEEVWKEYVGTPNSELIGYFRSLRPRFQTAILSNSFVGAREREEALYHFGEMCDFIVYSHEVGMSKPDPRIFALTCERLGLRPNEVIFLDDVGGHINAAGEFGIHGILFRNNAQAIAEIEVCIRANA